DLVVGGTALFLLAPLLGLVALVIRVVDGGPVFFWQTRIGLAGRPFQLIKFRTMERGAEDRLEELMPRNEIRGAAFKVTDDPRVTRSGGGLRAGRRDEAPQLWH